MKFERIVVGVDGSANSVAALSWAAALAGTIGAEVIAVHALGLLDRLDGETPVPAQPHRQEIVERFETAWCAPIVRSGVPYRRLLRDGSPISVLLAVAGEEHADVIVVGRHGTSGHPALLLGSTSTQVAQRAPQPVVVVPPT
jgi:nucleotide-binding universal stress UspA family protein